MDSHLVGNASISPDNTDGLNKLAPWLITSGREGNVSVQLGGGGMGSDFESEGQGEVQQSENVEDKSPNVLHSGVDQNSIDLLCKAASLVTAYNGKYSQSGGKPSFSELNINCGCPSKSARQGGFGAQLMKLPSQDHTRVAINQVVREVGCDIPVSVKCRIGVTSNIKYGNVNSDRIGYRQLSNFVVDMKSVGIKKIIVHARVCVLCGLSTGENRTVPPLRYDVVNSLVRDFRDIEFVVNGGVGGLDEAEELLGWKETSKKNAVSCSCGDGPVSTAKQQLLCNLGSDEDWKSPSPIDETKYYPSSVMIGRHAYNSPLSFWDADSRFYNATDQNPTLRSILEQYIDYATDVQEKGPAYMNFVKCTNQCTAKILQPMQNLFTGVTGNKIYKRKLNELLQRHYKNDNGLGGDGSSNLSDIVFGAVEGSFSEELLDCPIGDSREIHSVD